MAKQKPRGKIQGNQKSERATITPESIGIRKQIPNTALYLFIFFFSFLIYSNTLQNKFAIDDTIVLTDNTFTKRGFDGINDHFTHDMFEGFFGERGAKLVSGGRYRPLSMAMITVEYEIGRHFKNDKRGELNNKNKIMGDSDPYLNPVLHHFMNLLLFSLTCVTLFYLLSQIIPKKYSLVTPIGELGLAFFATLLYAAHPMHTEAVANVKGRDEVMCMLFSLLSLIAAIKYVRTKNFIHLAWGVVIYFIALMCKENAITFFAVIPLAFFFFTNAKVKDYAITLALYAAPAALFLFLRSQYTQAGLTQDSPEILNNPFLLATPSQHYATAIYTWLKYYVLMIFPHPLTHDYYYNQIAYVDFGSGEFLAAFFATVALIGIAFYGLFKKSITSFAILFFFVTFSVASNLLFTVGVLMNERFVYMSSLGFCMLFAYLFFYSKEKFKLNPNVVFGIFVVVLTLYSVKTYSRNFDWKDSFYLFRRDCIHSSNSAKIQTSLGGDLTKAADADISRFRDSGMIKIYLSDLNHGHYTDEEINRMVNLPDSSVRKILLDSSIAHLNEALRVYPNHSNAWLLLGNAIYKRNNNQREVIEVYRKAAATRVGGYYDAYFNLGVVYNELNMADSARDNLIRAFAMKPEQMECRFLLSQVYAKLNNSDSVNYWLKRGTELKEPTAADYYLIGTGFGKVGGNLPMAIEYLKIAVSKNPTAELYYEDLGVAYGLSGRFDEAIAASEKLVQINPKYSAAYMNLSVSYRNKKNMALAKQYYEKARELNPVYPPWKD